ncbi:MAG: hypothetical protein SNJ78_04325 [Spirochaetales bacterium]
MKLAVKKVSLSLGAGISFFLFVIYLAGLGLGLGSDQKSLLTNHVWTIVLTGGTASFSMFGGVGFRRLFRRISSLEIYFFLIFLISLSFDSLRVLNWVFFLRGISPYFGEMVTRAVYFGYFLGLFCLFTSSIFSAEISYQKTGSILSALGFFSLALSYSMPVDITLLNPNLLYRVGGEEYLLLVRIGLMSLTLLSFLRTALIARSREEWALCLAVGAILIGREIVFFRSDSFLGMCGFVLLIAGSIYFSRKSYLKHLWI